MLTSDRFLVAWTVFYIAVLLCYSTARVCNSDIIGGGILAFTDKHFPPTRMKIVCIMLFTGVLYCTMGGLKSAIHHTEVGTVIYSLFLAFKNLP